MRLWIVAVGHARGTAEGQLVDDFITRSRRSGKSLGFTQVLVEELAVSRQREAASRMKEEAEKLAARLPEGAHVILLDARGKGMTSEGFADMLGAMRDAGTRDLAFVIGGPDGLAALPGIKSGRSLAFGPQTWPHLIVRALLAEQVYRAMTILSGHPYHRA